MFGSLSRTFCGGRDIEKALAALQAPVAKVRRIEPFTAQQGIDLADAGAGVDLSQNVELVGLGEASPLGLKGDLGIRGTRRSHCEPTAPEGCSARRPGPVE